METFRQILQRDPRRVTAQVRANAKRAMMASPSDTDPRVTSLREFMMRHVPFGKAKTSAYVSLAVAAALDQMAAGDWDGAEAGLCLLLCALEQSAIDNGRWQLGWLLTHQPEPPWHLLQGQAHADPLRPFGKLSEPAWSAAAMAYVKDAAALAELRKKAPGGDGGN